MIERIVCPPEQKVIHGKAPGETTATIVKTTASTDKITFKNTHTSTNINTL